jgi:hypothetical protein
MRPGVYGIIFIVIGAIYIWKPTIFRRGLWMKTSVAIRMLSETNYTRYMRGLGFVLVVAGVVLILSKMI